MSDQINTNNSSIDIEPSDEISKITVKSFTINNTTYSSEWTTDGFKIPMVVNINGTNTPVFLLVPRDEVVKMFKDINEELSHT